MAFQPRPRHENHKKGGLLLRYERKERRERGGDFNGEKGERLFLPWIFFPLSSPSFLMIFIKKDLPAKTGRQGG